ncbi:MAG: DUF1295 domain-containing protein [Planctomycetota bacterium]|jgi:steroid 5-alpha reductase family enzyme
MSSVGLVLEGWLAVALAMLGLWLWQRRSGDAGIVDVAWTGGLAYLALLYVFNAPSETTPARAWLVTGMAVIWATRLLLYLLRDRILRGEEDGRYQTLRERWGADVQRNLFIFFQAQGALAALLSVHFLIAMASPRPGPDQLDLVGVAIWAISITGVTIADRQLERFRNDPANRGRTCRYGLWRYSRHPNYFFEWLHWLAYVPIAVGSLIWPVMAVAPLLMLFFILKVTGVPPTEAQALKSRGDDYRRYQQETSVFFPWFPRDPGSRA